MVECETIDGVYDGIYFHVPMPYPIIFLYVVYREDTDMFNWWASNHEQPSYTPYFFRGDKPRPMTSSPIYIYSSKPPSDSDGQRVTTPQPSQPQHA